MRYEPPAINFHLGETPPREPQGGGEHTECAEGVRIEAAAARTPIFTKTRLPSGAD